MTIEDELKSLIVLHAKYEQNEECYSSKLNNEELLRLDSAFKKLLYEWLLRNGTEKELILEQYRQVQSYFTAQNGNSLIPEVIWLEHNLSQGLNDGVCLKTLSDCYQKLTAPENFKEIKFSDITTREDLCAWLVNLKRQSKTYIESSLYENLLTLVNESGDYYDEVGKINLKGIRALLGFLPVVLVSLGTITFAEELLAIYALYFVLLKSGQLISGSERSELKSIGGTLQKISTITATTTTTLLVRLVEMIFWGSRQCYLTTLQLGSVIQEPLLSAKSYQALTHPSTLEEDLLIASKSLDIGKNFLNPQLKIIAYPIESRLGLLGQQYFLSLRTGKTKLTALNRLLSNLSDVDHNSDSFEIKLESTQRLLDKIKRNKTVYVKGSETAVAIDKAEGFLFFLKENPLIPQQKVSENIKEVKLITYDPVTSYF